MRATPRKMKGMPAARTPRECPPKMETKAGARPPRKSVNPMQKHRARRRGPAIETEAFLKARRDRSSESSTTPLAEAKAAGDPVAIASANVLSRVTEDRFNSSRAFGVKKASRPACREACRFGGRLALVQGSASV